MSRRSLLYIRRHGSRKDRAEWADKVYATHKKAVDNEGKVCSLPMSERKRDRLAGEAHL